MDQQTLTSLGIKFLHYIRSKFFTIVLSMKFFIHQLLEVEEVCSIIKTSVQGVEVQKLPIHVLFVCELNMS